MGTSSLTKRQVWARSLAGVFFVGALMAMEVRETQSLIAARRAYSEVTRLTSSQSIQLHRIGYLARRLQEDGPDAPMLRQDLEKELTELRTSLAEVDKLLRSPDPVLRERVRQTFAAGDAKLLPGLQEFLLDMESLLVNRETVGWKEKLAQLGGALSSARSHAFLLGSEVLSQLEKWVWLGAVLIVGAMLALIGFVFLPMLTTILRQREEQASAEERLLRQNEELRSSQKQSRQKRQMLQSVLDGMGEAVMVLQANGALLMHNPSAERLFGVLRTGQTFEEWFTDAGIHDGDTGEPFSPERSPLRDCLAGKPLDRRLLLVKNEVHPQGAYVIATDGAITDENGETLGAVLTFHDVQDRVESEKRLIEDKEAAEFASEAKSLFLASVSHEIRTPMTTILGYAEALLGGRQGPEQQRESLRLIHRSARLLMQLIDDIIDLSRAEQGRVDLEKGTVSLGELIQDVRVVLSPKARAKSLDLAFEAEGPVPARLHTDASRLRQVLINVVGNAIKFTERGAVHVSVRLEETGGEHRLRFGVNDTGCGISPTDAKRIFLPFVQAGGWTSRKSGGAGLGLAISKQLARALGGDLYLESSTPNVGSRFVIEIDPGPVSPQDLVPELPADSAAWGDPLTPPTSGLEGRSVLLVEDSPENAELFRTFLETAGARVDMARNGREGVEMALAGRHDVVLMDVQMPEKNGYEAVGILKERLYPSPVLALTAHGRREERERCKQAGFDELLVKPIGAKALVDAVAAFTRPSGRPRPAMVVSSLLRARDDRAAKASERIRNAIDTFRRDYPGRVDELKAAYRTADWDRLQRLAHKLKGTAGSCGFPEISRCVEGLEDELLAGTTGQGIERRLAELTELSGSLGG